MTPEQAAVAYQAQYGQLRTRAAAAVVAAWVAYGGISEADATRFIRAALPTVYGIQQAVASLVAAYFATITREVTGSATPAAIAPDTVTTDVLRGIDADEVYHRPVVTARTAIADGKTLDQAMDLARHRAEQIADSDIVLAQREAAEQAVAADVRIVGYRRVLTGESCSLCQIASTQRYRAPYPRIDRDGRPKYTAADFAGSLMPIHTHCDCSVAPIIGTSDPGQVINRELLDRLKAAGAVDAISRQREIPRARQGVETAQRRLAEVEREYADERDRPDRDQERLERLGDRRIQWRRRLEENEQRLERLTANWRGAPTVRQHGELGAVLVPEGDRFTGPEDLVA